MEKFDGEEEMLKRYAIHMQLLERFKKLGLGESWKDMMETTVAQENSKVTFLFMVVMFNYSMDDAATYHVRDYKSFLYKCNVHCTCRKLLPLACVCIFNLFNAETAERI